MYTVKQLADLAQVSVRTLHYYDQIGLLRPTKVGLNGYRYYDEAALLRLQQILLYREIGLELTHIRDVLDDPGFDLLTALRAHRAALEARAQRLTELIHTVDQTILHVTGEIDMPKDQLFRPFTPEEQKEYEREVRLTYDPVVVRESMQNWNGYSQAQRDAVMDEGNQIYRDFIAALAAQKSPQDADVQAIVDRWQQHIRHFYEPTLDILRGLGELYRTDSRFSANFEKLHAGLADYVHAAIDTYVDERETAEIARLLAEDESSQGRR